MSIWVNSQQQCPVYIYVQVAESFTGTLNNLDIGSTKLVSRGVLVF